MLISIKRGEIPNCSWSELIPDKSTADCPCYINQMWIGDELNVVWCVYTTVFSNSWIFGPRLARAKIVRAKQKKMRSVTSRAALLLRWLFTKLGHVRDNCHGNWTRHYTERKCSVFMFAAQMHGQRIVTFDRARNFGQGQALLSFINALVGAWRGPGAGLVLIKAAPK